MTRQGHSIGLLVTLVLIAFPSKCMAIWDDDIYIYTNPNPPRANESFTLAAIRSFPDAGYECVGQSISIDGNRIDISATIQDQHSQLGIFFANYVTTGGAWFDDFGSLAAGTYQTNVKIWLTRWPDTAGGQLIDEENLQFTVAAEVPEPDACLLLVCAIGSVIWLHRPTRTRS